MSLRVAPHEAVLTSTSGVICANDLAQVLDGERVTRNSDMFRPANPKLKAALFPPKKPESAMLPTKTFAARKREL